ncbi:MAG: substrate-binding domain-containing protein, partial [Eubacteriales bacterium]
MKKLLAMMLSVVMVATMMAGCSSSTETASTTAATTETAATEEAAPAAEEAAETTASEGTKTFAIVTKAAGNPFNERTASGFEEVILAEGYEVIVKHPEAATADAQVAVIQSLISQGVDAICIAANDENALQASLQEAMDEGIQVCCLDSKTNVASRSVFVNQAGVMEIGQALIDAVLDLTGGEGQWAILS